MKAGSCFVLDLNTKILKETDKETFIKAILNNTHALSVNEKNEKYKELTKMKYEEIIRSINLHKYSNDIFGTQVGQTLYAFILIDKTKEDLETFIRNKLTQTQAFYIINTDTGSYVRNYNDMLNPPIKSTRDKKEVKLYTDVKEALKDAKEMDELGVGDFVAKDYSTDITVDGLDYSIN